MSGEVWQSLHADLTPGPQPGSATFAATLGTRTILLPIRYLADGRRIASLIVNQASFTVIDALCEALADRLKPHAPDLIVGVPTLGLPVAEGVARQLGHARYLPLGVSRKFWYDEALSVPLRSITTPGTGKRLYFDPRMRPRLSGRVVLIDDVLYSGASIGAALSLLALVGVLPVAIGAAMLQGTDWAGTTGGLPVEAAIATPILPPDAPHDRGVRTLPRKRPAAAADRCRS